VSGDAAAGAKLAAISAAAPAGAGLAALRCCRVRSPSFWLFWSCSWFARPVRGRAPQFGALRWPPSTPIDDVTMATAAGSCQRGSHRRGGKAARRAPGRQLAEGGQCASWCETLCEKVCVARQPFHELAMEESRVIRPKNNGGRVPRPTTNRLLRSSAAPIP
jgi:hypothetical protein